MHIDCHLVRCCLCIVTPQAICHRPARSMVGRVLTSRLDPRRHRPRGLYQIELRWAKRGPTVIGSITHIGMASPMRISGTVKFFNGAKGFGFITPDEGGKDVFVHATAVEQAGMRALNEGDRVSFEVEDDRKGKGKQAAQLQKA